MPDNFYVALAENERAINDFATLGCAGQQMLLARMTGMENAEEKQRKLEELTK